MKLQIFVHAILLAALVLGVNFASSTRYQALYWVIGVVLIWAIWIGARLLRGLESDPLQQHIEDDRLHAAEKQKLQEEVKAEFLRKAGKQYSAGE
jgi:fatty acid desaturase